MDTHTIDATLAERDKRYGKFSGHAGITQAIKVVMATGCRWDALAADQREALEMIAHKIGRILNGDPDYADSWHDIAGYAKLVEDRLNPKPTEPRQRWAFTGDWRLLEECDAKPGQTLELCSPDGTVSRAVYSGEFRKQPGWWWRLAAPADDSWLAV